MKGLTIYSITLLFLLSTFAASAQFTVEITVNDGSATTTCTDIIGAPDPMWSVNVENQGWVTYPFNGFCYTSFPNQQFQQTYQCLSDIPNTLQVCFRAFENDASILSPCNEVTSCMEMMCMDVPIPPFGSQDFSIELPDGLASDGEVNLTIATSGIPGGVNDLPCQALDIGVIDNGTTVGMADTSIFNNFCSTNIGEIDPATLGANIDNDQAVWFKFTAGPNPGSQILIEAKSDPSNFGDVIDIELAVFTTDTDCNGVDNLITTRWGGPVYDKSLFLYCPQPNQEYYLMVDGRDVLANDGIEGYFGLQITEMDIAHVGDFICDAYELGPVPLGGAATNQELIGNGCATGVGEPCPGGVFCVQAGAWLSFVAPPTGHVMIDAISNAAIDDIDIQMAAYQTSDGTCNGSLIELDWAYTQGNSNESMELNCLNAGETYYILVDGANWLGSDLRGVFDIIVTDAGDESVTLSQNFTLCAGETLQVGNTIYDVTGNYVDTLELPSGCDSIVTTDLTVLDEIQFNLDFPVIGLNLGNTNGSASVNPSGGAGGYSILWSDGQTTGTASNLIGGDNYCVEVTDNNGCVVDTCFEMPYYENFITQFTVDTLDCFGDANAMINFTAELGEPPYLFNWQNSSSTLTGSGSISFDGQMVALEDLPADVYTINISDVNFDTIIQVEVTQPDLIEISDHAFSNASCFSVCDGSVGVNVIGGTPPYQFAWSNGNTSDIITGLCAGGYGLTVTDANGCTSTVSYDITEPDEFIVTAEVVQNVSCFQGNDGIASVSTNGTPQDYSWSTGETTQEIMTLSGGIYEVTVTNSDGCTSSSSIEILTPSSPVSVTILESEAIICNGEANGALEAIISGPGNNFTYEWSSGASTMESSSLAAGNYSVIVSNELGCSASANYLLEEPSEIQVVEFSTNSLTCADPIDGGIVTVDSIVGGVGPYTYSSNGAVYGTEPIITGFLAGANVFYVEDARGCIQEFDATIEGPQEILLNIGDNLTIELGDVVPLSVQSNISDLTYQWSPVESLSCEDCPSTDAAPLETTTYQVVVTDEFDCTETASITVNVVKKRKVYVPNAFSPNGDGINDEFLPFVGPDVAQINDFKIFDRQGNLVFEADEFLPGDLSNAWDGYFRGQLMQPAVFVWFAEITFIDGESEIYEGDLNLLR